MSQKIKEEQKKETLLPQTILVVGIRKNGEVIHFNNGCEEATGFSRDEILHKKLSEVLVSEQYQHQWEKILHLINSENQVDDFVIPWVTSDGCEVVILWSYLTHSDVNNDNVSENIFFTGKHVLGYEQHTSSPVVLPEDDPDNISETTPENIPHDNSFEDVLMVNLGNKYIKMRKKTGKAPDSESRQALAKQVHELKKIIDLNQRELQRLSRTVHTDPTKNKHDSRVVQVWGETTKELKEDTTQIQQVIDEPMTVVSSKSTIRETSPSPLEYQETVTTNELRKHLRFSFSKKRQEEFERQLHELDERRLLLALYESQLIEEKKTIEANKVAFQRWKEKLEQLEREIERRRVELVREEQAFREHILPVSLQKNVSQGLEDESEGEEVDYDEVLDNIPESAIVLQRGIVKQVNQSFAELLGYDFEELLEKRFYDFVDPEELGELEQYYLNRLKGDESSSYETVFFTKKKQKVPVSVSVKPTLYQGERADLVVIKTVAKHYK